MNYPDHTVVAMAGSCLFALFVISCRGSSRCATSCGGIFHTLQVNARCWHSVVWYLQIASLSFDIKFSVIRFAEKVRIYFLIVPLLLILCTSHNCRQFATTNLTTYTLRIGFKGSTDAHKNLVHEASKCCSEPEKKFGCLQCGFLNWRNVTVEFRFSFWCFHVSEESFWRTSYHRRSLKPAGCIT